MADTTDCSQSVKEAPGPAAAQTVPSKELASSTEPNSSGGAPFVTPPEHHRKRKSWSEEEKEAFWQRKKQEKKARKKAAAAQRQRDLQTEWEQLPDAEKLRRKEKAMHVHECRRAKEIEHQQLCEQNWANEQLPVLLFDLSFAWTMTAPDTKSTVSQLKLSYSTLRHADFPMRPVLTSLMGREEDDVTHSSEAQAAILQSSLTNFAGFKHFPPQMTEREHWSTLFPLENVVFLTADSEEVLRDIEPNHVYVVGAFVDHNQHKGLSQGAAARHGVRTARLPIQESIALGNRCKVLTINHVVSALVRYLETRDWTTAFEASLPTRRARQEEERSSHHQREPRRRVQDHTPRSDDDDESASGDESENGAPSLGASE